MPTLAPRVYGKICLRDNIPAPARGTTNDVVMDELCTNIVNNMPKLKPLNTVLKINLSKKLSILVNTRRRKSFTIENNINNVIRTLTTK